MSKTGELSYFLRHLYIRSASHKRAVHEAVSKRFLVCSFTSTPFIFQIILPKFYCINKITIVIPTLPREVIRDICQLIPAALMNDTQPCLQTPVLDTPHIVTEGIARYGSYNDFDDRSRKFKYLTPKSLCLLLQSLAGTALKGLQAFNTYHSQYSNAAVTMASMMTQCSCVQFAIRQIQEVVMNNPPSAFLLRSDAALTEHFSSVFGAYELVFSILNER